MVVRKPPMAGSEAAGEAPGKVVLELPAANGSRLTVPGFAVPGFVLEVKPVELEAGAGPYPFGELLGGVMPDWVMVPGEDVWFAREGEEFQPPFAWGVPVRGGRELAPRRGRFVWHPGRVMPTRNSPTRPWTGILPIGFPFPREHPVHAARAVRAVRALTSPTILGGGGTAIKSRVCNGLLGRCQGGKRTILFSLPRWRQAT